MIYGTLLQKPKVHYHSSLMIHHLFSKISLLTLTEHYEMLVKLFLNQLSFSVVTNADGFDYNFFVYHHQ